MTSETPQTAENDHNGLHTITTAWHPDAIHDATTRLRAVIHAGAANPDHTHHLHGHPLTWTDLAVLNSLATLAHTQADQIHQLHAEIAQLNSHPWCTSQHDHHGCALLRGHNDDHTNGTTSWPNHTHTDHLAGDLHDDQEANRG